MSEFRKNPLKTGQIVFMGNSLTQGGKWSEYFPKQKPANRGISGDNTEGMLARLDEIVKAQPEKLFFLGGVNDISQNVPNDTIIKNIRTIIRRTKKESPGTIIYIQSPLPINNSFERYKRLTNKENVIDNLNKKLKKLCKKEKVNFIYIHPAFLIKKQTLDAKYTTDGLHLNKEGYSVWAKELSKYIE
ncbi:hypothetical protein D0T56_08985 [Dysgonomonas sp. 520]|nr:hypothetical protein [Dysgonomonas sp. 520]